MSTKFKTFKIEAVANGYLVYVDEQGDFFRTPVDKIFVFTSPATLAAWLEKNIAVPAAGCADVDAVGCCGGPGKTDAFSKTATDTVATAKVPQSEIERLEANREAQRKFDERVREVDENVRKNIFKKRVADAVANFPTFTFDETERDPATSREENARKFAPEDEDCRGQEVPSLPTITSREGAAIVHEAMAKTYKQAERAVHDGKAVSIPGV